MVQNDPLQLFFNLSYPTIFTIAVALGLISVVVTKLRTKLPILKRPLFLFGDLLLLPLAITLISSFYKNAHFPLAIIASWQWTLSTFLFSLFLTIFVVKRFRLWHIIWIIPDLLFFLYSYIFITFFTKAIVQLLLGDNESHFLWFLWLGTILCLGTHQAIGTTISRKEHT